MNHSPPATAGPRSVLTGSGPGRRLTLPLLSSIAGLVHAFTLKDSDPAVVLRETLGPGSVLCTLKQRHGVRVHRVTGETGGATPEDPPIGDALVTDRRGVALAVRVADCVPILACDQKRGVLAAVHAGWRGTVAGILTRVIEALVRDYGIRPADLRIAMGPAIGPCCFEVGEEVVEALLLADPGGAECVRPGATRRRLDLIAANRRQAIAAGVPDRSIQSADLCTFCRPDLLLSYRRDRDAGRMTALIAWRR